MSGAPAGSSFSVLISRSPEQMLQMLFDGVDVDLLEPGRVVSAGLVVLAEVGGGVDDRVGAAQLGRPARITAGRARGFSRSVHRSGSVRGAARRVLGLCRCRELRLTARS
jgi:hypothetical protein